ncbi:MAG: hypothetical protein AAF598_01695 [Bacteroidota bacterium]
MKVYCFIILLLIGMLSGTTSSAQEEKTPFRFIARANAIAPEYDQVSGPIYEHAKEIFDHLVEVLGNRKVQPPSFQIIDSKEYGAFLEADKRSIVLEEQAYKVCMNLGTKEEGESVLAMILGHELIHYFENHRWRSEFINNYRGIGVVDSLADVSKFGVEKLRNETQADVLGGFLAYTAGYRAYHVLPKFFPALYKAYELPDELPGYPVLQDRVALAKRSVERIEKLAEIYDMGNILLALEHYDQARIFYRFILETYQSREVYNNLGVLTILHAMEYYEDQDSKLFLPVALDLNFDKTAERGLDESELALRKKLLEEALSYLYRAIDLDRDYAPAYQNLAVAYYLLGDEDRMNYFAQIEARQAFENHKKQFPRIGVYIDNLMALQLYKKDPEKGLERLKKLSATDSTLALVNYQILGKQELEPVRHRGPRSLKISDLKRRDLTAYTSDFNLQFNVPKEQVTQFFSGAVDFKVWKGEELPGSMIYKFETNAAAKMSYPAVVVHITDPSYTGAINSRFKKGASASEFTQQPDESGEVFGYGPPKHRLNTANGQIMVYDHAFFFVNAQNEIYRWENYDYP